MTSVRSGSQSKGIFAHATASVAAVAGLLTPVSGPLLEAQLEQDPTFAFSRYDRITNPCDLDNPGKLQEAANEMAAEWRRKGMLRSAQVEILFIADMPQEGCDVLVNGDAMRVDSSTQLGSSQAIAVSGSDGNPTEQLLITAHELGHIVYDNEHPGAITDALAEGSTDCYAGVSARDLEYEDAIIDAFRVSLEEHGATHPRDVHAMGAGRVALFDRGYQTGDCTPFSLTYIDYRTGGAVPPLPNPYEQ